MSEDNQYLLSGGSGSGPVGGQLVMWDRRNEKKPVHETHAHHDGVYGCHFMKTTSNNLYVLVCNSWGGCGSSALCVRVCSVVSVGGDSSVRVWQQETLEEVCHGELPEPGAITGVARATQDL